MCGYDACSIGSISQYNIHMYNIYTCICVSVLCICIYIYICFWIVLIAHIGIGHILDIPRVHASFFNQDEVERVKDVVGKPMVRSET